MLLAENEVGFRNLRYLVSMGYLEGFYHRPRIDKDLLALLDLYRPEWCVGVGGFAEQRLTAVADGACRVGRVLHPSPASPAANRGWEPQAERQLEEQGVWPATAAR